MNAGKMCHRITFQRPATDKDALGGYEGDWVDVCQTWAQVSPISGREYFSQVRENTISHKIYCRYRPGITPQNRILFGKRVFRIISVINWDEKGQGLTIMCEERVHE